MAGNVSSSSDAWYVEVVECPICLEVPRAKVYQCEQGHPICERCYKKMDRDAGRNRCGVARCDFTREPRRHRTIEQLVDKSGHLFRCANEAEGCKAKMTKADIAEHNDRCGFKKMKCIVKKRCCDRPTRHGLAAHVQDFHPERDRGDRPHSHYSLTKRDLRDRSNSTESWSPVLHTLPQHDRRDLHFYSRFELTASHGLFTVQADTDDHRLRGMKCRISVSDGNGLEVVYKGPLNDIETPMESMLEEERGLRMSRGMLRRMTQWKEGEDGRGALVAQFGLMKKRD